VLAKSKYEDESNVDHKIQVRQWTLCCIHRGPCSIPKYKNIFLPTNSFTCKGAPVLAQTEQQDESDVNQMLLGCVTCVTSALLLSSNPISPSLMWEFLYLNVNVATSLSLEVIRTYEWGLLFEDAVTAAVDVFR